MTDNIAEIINKIGMRVFMRGFIIIPSLSLYLAVYFSTSDHRLPLFFWYNNYMKRKCIGILIIVFVLLSLASCHSAEMETKQKFIGSFVCFDEATNEFQLKRGTVTVENGMMVSVDDEIPEQSRHQDNNTVVLNDNQLIFPGLIDLHSHAECNMIQMFSDEIMADIEWDNRFEWRYPPNYFKEYKNPSVLLSEDWNRKFDDVDSNLTVGDMVALYSEIQAVSGGTVLLQEDDNTSSTPFLDNHERIGLIRSTSSGDDLGRDDNLPMKSLVRLYKPMKDLSAEDVSSYMPHQVTDWGIIQTEDSDSGEAYIDVIIDTIKNSSSKKQGGFLIHLSEGRAGNLCTEYGTGHLGVDVYTDLEFETFKAAIEDAIAAGTITSEEVKKANINLIHACGVNLENPNHYMFLKECGIGLIWSPVSNLLLYKDTPNLYKYLDDDMLNICIGSDWSPSGAKTVWDESKFARSFICEQENLSKAEEDSLNQAILASVTVKAARMVGSKKLGNIAAGNYADFMILDAGQMTINNIDDALNAFYQCDERNIEMVYVNGRPIYGDRSYIDSFLKENRQYTWACVESQIDSLNSKYLNVTQICDEEAFSQLLNAFRKSLKEYGFTVSLLRSHEDSVYLDVMNVLGEKFCDLSIYTQ